MLRSKIFTFIAAGAIVVGASGGHGRAQAPPSQPTPPQGGAAPVRVGGNVRPPRKIRDVRPVYPAEALAAGVQGIVIVEATIGADGKVADARVLRSAPPLDQAALDAVRQWEFEPTTVDGVPTPIIVTVTVNFSLGGGAPAGPTALSADTAASRSGAPVPCASLQQMPAERTSRRDAAIRFMDEVNSKERLALIESQSKRYVPPAELPGAPAPPSGFEVQFVSEGASYSLSAVETQEVCRLALFTDQRGVVYIGVPVRDGPERLGIR
jgi:TonB family protein